MYDDKKETMKRLVERLKGLEERIKKRIVLENDEKCYSPEDLLSICEEVNIPLVYDVLHDHVYRHMHKSDDKEISDDTLQKIINTWKRRGLRPKCHLSESDNSHKRNNNSRYTHKTITGKHSMFINDIPKEIRKLCCFSNVGIDVMIEAKGKEEAIFRLYEKFPQLKAPCLNNDQIKEVEDAVKKNIASQESGSVSRTHVEEKKVHFQDSIHNDMTDKNSVAQSVSRDSTESMGDAKSPVYISDIVKKEENEKEEEEETLGQMFDNVISSLSPSPYQPSKRVPPQYQGS